MYLLYGYRGSGSAAVECALEMGALPYRLETAASWGTSAQVAKLQRLNPLRQIPTLVLPDGSSITESAAILLHLAFSHPEIGLLPSAGSKRAQALRGLVYIPANCYSLVSVLDYPERYLARADDGSKQNLLVGTKATLHRHWLIFAELFPPQPFLVGELPGALDILAAVVTRWSGARQFLVEQRPAFADFFNRMDNHPLFKPVMSRHWGIEVAAAGSKALAEGGVEPSAESEP